MTLIHPFKLFFCTTFLIIFSSAKITKVNNISESINTIQLNENDKIYSEWTPWSRCSGCWQSRLKICTNPKCKNSRMYEERPCDRKRCLRQRQMKSINKRLHIIRDVKENIVQTKRLRKSVWSKWSSWNKCSTNCKTERFKTCKYTRYCKTKTQIESAYCFMENTNCELYVLQLMDKFGRKVEEVTQYEYITPNKSPYTTKRRNKCGRPNRKTNMLKIIGGKDALPNKWPWHVAILNKYNEIFCSGTLIAPRWVITAAHCLRPQLQVRLNEYKIGKNDIRKIEMKVWQYFKHPDFDQQTVDNDIALLRLPKAVQLTYACLPHTKPKVNQHCNIMGWGKTNIDDKYGSNVLQEAKIPIVHTSTCLKSYRKYYISDNMFCAGHKDGRVDTCAGDSGGALMCRTSQGAKKKYLGYTIQGITSFGEGCGLKDKYGIYTNVYNYIEWINHTIKKRRNRSSNYVPIN